VISVLTGQAGKSLEAIGEYEEALRINPGLAEAHYCLAVALTKLGWTTEAVEQFEQALELRPDYTAACDALARLRADS